MSHLQPPRMTRQQDLDAFLIHQAADGGLPAGDQLDLVEEQRRGATVTDPRNLTEPFLHRPTQIG